MEAVNEARAAKEAQVKLVRDNFSKSVAAVLLDFRGVSVEMITELRARFRAAGIEYRVVKNTLVQKAIAGTDLENNQELAQHLKGPTGIAWSYEDPSAAAKVVKKFRKEHEDHEKLTVKCGILETTILGSDRVETELASLPGKDEVRAMLLAQLLAPAQSLVRQLAAPGQNFAYLLDARKRQLEEG